MEGACPGCYIHFPERKAMYDIIVIGAGPAGLTAAVYARRAEKSVLVIEKDTFGGQVTGLGPEHTHTIYVEDKSYTFIEVTAVIVLIIVVLLMIWVYRKPVKNFGKPKARR